MRPSLLQVPLAVMVWATGFTARAEDEPPSHHFFLNHHKKKEGTPPPGQARCIPHTDASTGYPRSLYGHLEPSATPGGIGYYVGGGVCLGHGQGRRRVDGTWGWDETGGQHLRRRIILGWSGGRKYQGGTGAYRTDGPVVPDIIYATTSTINSLGRREEGEDRE
jgi:hypothetical protein